MAKPVGTRQICCYHCGHDLEVSRRTMSTSCPECNRKLLVEDITVKSYTGLSVLETCGLLVIPKRKRLSVMTHVVAHEGIKVEGRMACEAAISRGPVIFGPKADWEGDLRAPSLTVHAGAVIRAGHFSIPEAPKVPG